MSSIDEIVGRNIKRLRKQNGLTQEQLARYSHIDQTTISKIESGQRSIGVSALEKLCDLFFCSLDDILNEPENLTSPKAVAFRADGLSQEDLPAVAAIGRIVRNLEEITSLEEECNG